MPNSDLVNYIQQNRQQGQVDDQIRQALIQAGWQPADIESAFLDLTQPRYPSQTSSLPSSPGSEPTMTIATELRGPIELLTQSWQIFTTRWKTLLVIIFIPYLVWIIIGVISLIAFLFWVGGTIPSSYSEYSSLLPMMAVNKFTQLPTSFWVIVGVGLFLLILAISYFFTWAQLALMQAIKDHQERISIKTAFSRSRHKILRYWWLLLLEYLIIIGGLAFFVLPGLIFVIWFLLSMWVLVNEDIGGLTGLLKTRFYVQGYWWGVLGRVLFLVVFFIIFSLIISMPSNLLKELPSGRLLYVIYEIITVLIGFVIGPIMLIYQYLLYDQLKALKSGQEFNPTGKSKLVFTLFGLWGILAALAVPAAVIVLVAVNPVKQFQEARDANRKTDIVEIQ